MSAVNTNKKPTVTFLQSAGEGQTKPHASTGPKTPGGKQKASQNSQTHACTASYPIVNGRVPPEIENRIVLPDEKVEDWEAVKQNWHQEYQPETEVHRTLVLQAIISEWMMRRTLRRYNEIEQTLFAQQPDSTKWSSEQHAGLERFLRYHTKTERAFHRARQALERLRREKKQDTEAARTQLPVPLSPSRKTSQPKPDEESSRYQVAPAEVSTDGAVPLLPRNPGALIQCITVQVLDGETFTLFQPRSEILARMIANALEPKPTVKRALYFLDGIPAEYEWITEYESHDGRPHYVITRTSEQAAQDLEREKEEGSGHVLRVSADYCD